MKPICEKNKKKKLDVSRLNVNRNAWNRGQINKSVHKYIGPKLGVSGVDMSLKQTIIWSNSLVLHDSTEARGCKTSISVCPPWSAVKVDE